MRYLAFSKIIESPFPLALPKAPASRQTNLWLEPQDEVRLGDLPWSLGRIRYGREGTAIGVHIPWVGDFLAADSGQVRYRKEPGVPDAQVGLYFTGLVLSFLLRSDDLLIFHGSAVTNGTEGWLFLGHQGAGKSTTAAALVGEGKTLMGDDLTPVAPGPLLKTGIPWSKLLPDALETLFSGRPPAHAWDGVDKFSVNLGTGNSDVRLAAVFLLEPAPVPHVQANALRGFRKFSALREHLNTLAGFDDPAVQMDLLSQGLGQVPVWVIQRPDRGDSLAEVTRLILSIVENTPSGEPKP